MNLLNHIIDRLQATFPPNRLMLILAGPIVAASAWISAFVTGNVPGATLPVGIVAGVIGAAVLIVITLIYKWFDRWQEGERIDYQGDLEQAAFEFSEAMGPDEQAFFAALGTLQGTGDALANLRAQIETDDGITEAGILDQLTSIGDVVEEFLAEKAPEPEVVAAERPINGDE